MWRWVGQAKRVEQALARGGAAAAQARAVAASLARWKASLGKGTGAMVSGACTSAAGSLGSPKPTTCKAEYTCDDTERPGGVYWPMGWVSIVALEQRLTLNTAHYMKRQALAFRQ